MTVHLAARPASSEGVTSTLAVRGLVRHDRTRVVTETMEFPQRVTVPMDLDPDRRMAYVCVQNPTAGMFPGDRLLTRVLLEDGARMHLTQQAATQVFASPHASAPDADRLARHEYVVELGEHSVLEQINRRTIPHAQSLYEQAVRVTMARSAVYLGWESSAAGRIGRGERHRYQQIATTTEIRLDGRVVVRDSFRLTPQLHDPDRFGALAGHDYVGTLLVVAPGHDAAALARALQCRLAELLPPGAEAIAGASTLPNGVGATCRVLARRAPVIDLVRDELRRVVRAEVLGLPTPAERW